MKASILHVLTQLYALDWKQFREWPVLPVKLPERLLQDLPDTAGLEKVCFLPLVDMFIFGHSEYISGTVPCGRGCCRTCLYPPTLKWCPYCHLFTIASAAQLG